MPSRPGLIIKGDRTGITPAGNRKLGRRAARSFIKARLKALDQSPDFATDDAAQALIDHAGGSERALRAGLSAALFLASTEHAPRLECGHVARALEGVGLEAAPEARDRRGLILAGLLVGATLGASAILVMRRPGPPPALPARLTATVIPPAATPSRGDSLALPDGPIPDVRLFVSYSNRTTSAVSLDAVTRRLRQDGMEPVLIDNAGAVGGDGAQVWYYFTEDRMLAERVSHVIGVGAIPPRLAPFHPWMQVAPGRIDVRVDQGK